MYMGNTNFRSALAVFLCNFNVRKTIRLLLLVTVPLAYVINFFSFFGDFLLGCGSLILKLHHQADFCCWWAQQILSWNIIPARLLINIDHFCVLVISTVHKISIYLLSMLKNSFFYRFGLCI